MANKLVIFDCDGVLVDSEPIASKIFCELLNETGLKITIKQTVELFEGLSDKDCIIIVEKMLGKKVQEDFLKTFEYRMFKEFREKLKPVKNVITAISMIQYPACVASSGTHEKMEISLGITGLIDYFNGKIFSSTEVKRGKPNPDLFLYAAKSMNTNPADCIVIEDSVNGVKAGVAAGMRVLGYCERTPAESLKVHGAETFKDMLDLPGLLS